MISGRVSNFRRLWQRDALRFIHRQAWLGAVQQPCSPLNPNCQIVASYLWWRFMRTAVASKWQRWAGRGAQDSKRSSGRRSPLSDFLSRFRGAHQNCRGSRLPEPCGRCLPSEISCPLTLMLSSNRYSFPQRATARTLSSRGLRAGYS